VVKTQNQRVTNALAAASIGVVQLGLAISLAALIFAGPLNAGAGRAASGFLLGTAIVSVLVGSVSKMSVVIAGAQDTAAIMVASAAATVVAAPEISASELVPTAVMLIAISTVLTGAVFWIIGNYGLTAFVRYLPFPVISGFTAGTGWLLLRGGIEVMHGEAFELAEFIDLLAWQHLRFILPGLALAAAMVAVVVIDKLPNTLLGVAILGSALLFHAVVRGVSSLDQVEADGWLLGPFAADAGWAPIQPSDISEANWSVLLDKSLLIVAVVAVSVIGLLLNLSGLENGPDQQIDMNSEMKSAGLANVLSGLGSGVVGYHLLGDTVLGRQIGARGRSVPIALGVIAAIAFLIGLDLIALVPRMVAGGVLAGLGFNLLVSWVRTSLSRLNRTDQVLSAMILLAIALFGILAGVGAGVLVAATVFIVKYSRTESIRHVMLAAGRSTIDRDDHDQRALEAASESVLTFELQGYLFFGSTTKLRRRIDERVAAAPPEFLIIDFARVTGIDSTAATGLSAIANQLEQVGIVLVWSGATEPVAKELAVEELDQRMHDDLDHAIAWCEDQILGRTHDRPIQSTAALPFDDGLLQALDLPTLTLDAGQTLISAGDTDSDVYFIEAGRLSAWISNEQGKAIRIRQVLPGTALGEIAFCTGVARTATVIADEPAIVRVLRRERFDEVAAANPAIAVAVQHELLRRLSHKVSSTSALVRDLLK